MVHRCIICGDSSNIKKPNISFHVFPAQTVRRNKWLNAINKEGIVLEQAPTKSSRICSKHFKESCFITKRLRIDAVPTIFKLPNLSSIKSQLRNKINLQEPELWTNLFPVALTSRTATEIKTEPTESLSLNSNTVQDPISISNNEQASYSKQTSTNATENGQDRLICNNSPEEQISPTLNEKTLTIEKRIVDVPLLNVEDTNNRKGNSIPAGIEIINKNVTVIPLSHESLEPIKEYYVLPYEVLKDMAERNKVIVKNELFSDASFTNTWQDNDFRLKNARIEMKAAKRILSNVRKKLKCEYQKNRRLERRVIRMRNVVKNLRKRR